MFSLFKRVEPSIGSKVLKLSIDISPMEVLEFTDLNANDNELIFMDRTRNNVEVFSIVWNQMKNIVANKQNVFVINSSVFTMPAVSFELSNVVHREWMLVQAKKHQINVINLSEAKDVEQSPPEVARKGYGKDDIWGKELKTIEPCVFADELDEPLLKNYDLLSDQYYL
ncbi:hypothetical protein BLOT_008735 [Blomia tropicalis]|nr:hypothetical protein BLOT_008735 [Blomia tropicalis]